MARCRRLFRNLIYVYMLLLTSFVLIRYTPSISSSDPQIRDEHVNDAEPLRPTQPASVVVQQPEAAQQQQVDELPQRKEQPKVMKIDKLETDGYHHLLYPGVPLDGALARPVPQRKLGDIGTGADIVIGVPTVQRDRISYLEQTLRSLFDNMFNDEQAEHVRPTVKVLVFIGEVNSTYVDAKMNEITTQFAHQLDFGLLEVISVAEDYYPEDWSEVVHLQFGDALERTKWRSKQNLDQIFLMMYISSQLKPSYYLMMEDDVVADKGYVNQIMAFVDEHKDREWFYLSFCNLGAIGKLFKARTLPSYAAFLHLFWNRKPLDWLQNDYVNSMVCNYDKSSAECQKTRQTYMIQRRYSLFQHKGKVSSLAGKKQLLQDRSFQQRLPVKKRNR